MKHWKKPRVPRETTEETLHGITVLPDLPIAGSNDPISHDVIVHLEHQLPRERELRLFWRRRAPGRAAGAGQGGAGKATWRFPHNNFGSGRHSNFSTKSIQSGLQY